MTKYFLVFLTLLYLSGNAQQNSDQIKWIQEPKAQNFIELIEKKDTTNAYKLLSSKYYLKNAKRLSKFYKLFFNDYKDFSKEVRRVLIITMPKGYNVFQYSYLIIGTGIQSQVCVYFKDSDENSPITSITYKSKKTYTIEKKTNIEMREDFE
jgi:hypothetical protein